MRAIILLACMGCASYARRARSSERMQRHTDANPMTSVARLLLANSPAVAFTASGVSRPVLLDSQHRSGHVDMFFGKKKGVREDTDPVDAYVSRMKDNLSSEDVIDVEFTKEERARPKPFADETDYDVIIVGAGCSGIGMALMLTRTFNLNISRVLVVEQAPNVGNSFRQWPKEMKFISPSFNSLGWTSSFDLNAICFDTSPAHSLRTEHPSGKEYAAYLRYITGHLIQSGLDIQFETKVTDIRDVGKKGTKEEEREHPGPFRVEVSREGVTQSMSTRYVVWAAGEFKYPKNKDSLLFPGAELGLHNSLVQSWAELPGDDFIIIGGYESGVDAAVNLAKAGKKCKVIASTPCWNLVTGDPSSELAPYTASRLREVLSSSFTPRPKLFAPLRVVAVDEAEGGGFDVVAKWGEVDEDLLPEAGSYGYIQGEKKADGDGLVLMHTKQPPILATGFEGSVAAQASHLFEFPDAESKKGCIGSGPLLTRNDESTKVPGVFLVGPSVTHGKMSFCFVYKFRQRFAVVANAIAQGFGMDTEAAVAECRQVNMYLDDLGACADGCNELC